MKSVVLTLKFSLIPILSGWFWIVGCARQVLRDDTGTISVFVSRWAGPEQLTQDAAVVQRARAAGPCVWVVLGEIFSEHEWTQLTDGVAQIELLNAVGADAVALSPEWLEFPQKQLYRLLNHSKFYVLGGNILDSLGETIGHPFMLATLGRARLGFFAVWPDTADPRLNLASVNRVSAEMAASKFASVLRGRADLLFAVVNSPDSMAIRVDWNTDVMMRQSQSNPMFTVPQSGIARLLLYVQDGRVRDYRISHIRTDTVNVAPALKKVLDSLSAAVSRLSQDSVEIGIHLSAEAATKQIAETVADASEAVFLLDQPLVRGDFEPGITTLGQLVKAFWEPGRLWILEVSGRELQSLLLNGAKALWGGHTAVRRILLHRPYKICTTPSFVSRHPQLHGRKYELTSERLWVIGRRVLEKRRP